MKNFEDKKKSKMIAMPRLVWKSIKIMMWKFLRGGATVIPGASFIPESRVTAIILLGKVRPIKLSLYVSANYVSKLFSISS